MDAILYMSQAVFEAIIYIATAGMGATVVLLLVILSPSPRKMELMIL